MTLPYLQPLEADDLAALGIPDGWPFGVSSRVRFTELDPLGHVNNAVFLSWFEDFRIAYMPARGFPPLGEGPRLVLAETGCRYLREMLVEDDYVVTGRTRTLGSSSFVMDYAVWRMEAEGPVQTAAAHAAVVLRSPDGKSKFPLPEDIRARLHAEGATER